ncbi:MAG: hypothetical protein AAF958_03630 [Planctomycetota bacterium]
MANHPMDKVDAIAATPSNIVTTRSLGVLEEPSGVEDESSGVPDDALFLAFGGFSLAIVPWLPLTDALRNSKSSRHA